MTVVLIGGGQRTLKTLQFLLGRDDIALLFLLIQKDYSNEEPYYLALRQLARKHGIPYRISPSGVTPSSQVIDRIRGLSPDLILRGGNWRAILPPRIWETSRYGCLGMHGSALPQYRGWANLNWYIINGETNYFLQAFRFNENIDDGDLIFRPGGSPLKATIPLDNNLSMLELLEIADSEHLKLTAELLSLLEEGQAAFVPQDASKQTWTCHRGPEDAEIDWTQPSPVIHNFIRGQSYPSPGAFTFHRGQKLYIWDSGLIPDAPTYVGRIPGKIVKTNVNHGTWVLTGDSLLEIREVTLGSEESHPQKRYQSRKPSADILKSVKEKLGLNLYQELRRIKGAL